MFQAATPVLHVSRASTAEEFYCSKLGFKVESTYRIDDAEADPCYMVLSRDTAWLHVSSFSGDAVVGGVVYLLVDDVDALRDELVAKDVAIAFGPQDQSWGNRELYIKDPDGNSIRFVREG